MYNLTHVEGETVNFTCTADGNPTPNITWRTLDGSETSNPLVKPNISRTDIGNYACVARSTLTPSMDNDFNVTIEESVYLDVLCKYETLKNFALFKDIIRKQFKTIKTNLNNTEAG